jgi:hypothetical protein
MLRRTMLTGAAALGGGAASGLLAPRSVMAAAASLREAARDAWIYTLPLNEIANVRARSLTFGAKAGEFVAQKDLANPTTRTVTTPNVDTIYASAFIDLTNGPATLTVPPLGERYASFALMDMWSDNIAVLGTRTTGPDGGSFTLVGPDAAAHPDALRSPTNWVWALARVVVNGPADIEAARAVQAGFKVEAAAAGPFVKGAKREDPWQDYFRAADALLRESAPPQTDIGVLRRIAPFGVGPYSATPTFDPDRFSPDQQAQISAGVADALAIVKNAALGVRIENGWIYSGADTGNFFQDYTYRARIALSGLAALPPAEAMYLNAVGPDGRNVFDGESRLRLHFPKGQLPPVDAFWSLTMYEATSQGQFFLTENPIHRYAIGDRTPGLTFNKDGSLDLWIARDDPGDAKKANWLPAPAKGPFGIFLRVYLPKPQMITRAYLPPRLETL